MTSPDLAAAWIAGAQFGFWALVAALMVMADDDKPPPMAGA